MSSESLDRTTQADRKILRRTTTQIDFHFLKRKSMLASLINFQISKYSTMVDSTSKLLHNNVLMISRSLDEAAG